MYYSIIANLISISLILRLNKWWTQRLNELILNKRLCCKATIQWLDIGLWLDISLRLDIGLWLDIAWLNIGLWLDIAWLNIVWLDIAWLNIAWLDITWLNIAWLNHICCHLLIYITLSIGWLNNLSLHIWLLWNGIHLTNLLLNLIISMI